MAEVTCTGTGVPVSLLILIGRSVSEFVAMRLPASWFVFTAKRRRGGKSRPTHGGQEAQIIMKVESATHPTPETPEPAMAVRG